MTKPVLKNKIKHFLSDPGLQLNHPSKKDITLEDIFVYPNIKLLNKKIISSKELLQIKTGSNKISISGIEDSGKTTLIKALIKHYLNSGYYPVYIDAQRLTINDPDKLQLIIDRKYEEMYKPDSLDAIRIESNKKKAVFIDNLDKANIKIKELGKILYTLCNEFDNLIFSEETPFNILEDLQLKDLYPKLSKEINRYEILDFSNELQSQLIERWHKLTDTDELDRKDLFSKTEKTKEIFNTVLGNKIVPSLPIFLLTILQFNSDEETELVSGSSYSHYYEHLTIKSIVNSIDHQEIEPYLEFLSELSYYMFKQDKQSVSYEELNHIYESKCTYRDNIKSLELLIESLINSATLLEETFYRFSYRYIYCYFVARYLSNKIELEAVIEEIENIFRELYNDDYSHIALFLTYLSDDTLITDELLLRTKSTFSEESLVLKDDDSHEIDEIIAELSTLESKDKKLREKSAEYISFNINMTNTYLILEKYMNRGKDQIPKRQYDSEGLRIANNLIKIVNEVLRNRKNSYT